MTRCIASSKVISANVNILDAEFHRHRHLIVLNLVPLSSTVSSALVLTRPHALLQTNLWTGHSSLQTAFAAAGSHSKFWIIAATIAGQWSNQKHLQAITVTAVLLLSHAPNSMRIWYAVTYALSCLYDLEPNVRPNICHLCSKVLDGRGVRRQVRTLADIPRSTIQWLFLVFFQCLCNLG